MPTPITSVIDRMSSFVRLLSLVKFQFIRSSWVAFPFMVARGTTSHRESFICLHNYPSRRIQLYFHWLCNKLPHKAIFTLLFLKCQISVLNVFIIPAPTLIKPDSYRTCRHFYEHRLSSNSNKEWHVKAIEHLLANPVNNALKLFLQMRYGEKYFTERYIVYTLN